MNEMANNNVNEIINTFRNDFQDFDLAPNR